MYVYIYTYIIHIHKFYQLLPCNWAIFRAHCRKVNQARKCCQSTGPLSWKPRDAKMKRVLYSWLVPTMSFQNECTSLPMKTAEHPYCLLSDLTNPEKRVHATSAFSPCRWRWHILYFVQQGLYECCCWHCIPSLSDPALELSKEFRPCSSGLKDTSHKIKVHSAQKVGPGTMAHNGMLNVAIAEMVWGLREIHLSQTEEMIWHCSWTVQTCTNCRSVPSFTLL